jgi:predicted XRE-type DNA-binding protein
MMIFQNYLVLSGFTLRIINGLILNTRERFYCVQQMRSVDAMDQRLYIERMKTDLSKIVVALMHSGLTQNQIAQAVGCSQPNIAMIASKKSGAIQPTLKTAMGLIDLAAKHGITPTGTKKRASKEASV